MAFELKTVFARDLAVGDIAAYSGAGSFGYNSIFVWDPYPSSDPQGMGHGNAGKRVVVYQMVTHIVEANEPYGDGGIPAYDVTFPYFCNDVIIYSPAPMHYRAYDLIAIALGDIVGLGNPPGPAVAMTLTLGS